ncbi:LacI family DNA-binding transcriptional regulator [Falsirhodobacter algicola]|uniref:Substrate-binding domain-containing protein n=1 Tax=Falsirhodobacter algicola TaxID=2692330 RepID=A0A8J8MUP8_9RHOB|nr:LacI family DNA-binding transcriptional regulator [Falsirhodobacter algicola]QUS37065.1 substrate-binding domain-containing protein [Falsirhodobacter algicola]
MASHISLTHIAETLGVSRATVSNALSGRGRVSPALAERIRNAAEEMRYVPSAAARSLRSGRSTLVGMVVPDFTMPLFGVLAQAFERAAKERGMALLVRDGRGDPAIHAEMVADLVARGVDGIVVVPVRGDDSALDHVPVPLAVVDAASNPRNIASCDHRAGARMAIGHLADLGHRSVEIIVSATRSHVSNEREAGMLAAAEAFGLKTRVRHLQPDFDTARTHARTWRPDGATAIAAAFDAIGVGLIAGFIEAGVRVPQDVSVTGFDNTIWGRIIRPDLTTVTQDLDGIADHVLDVLIGRAAGQRLFPGTLAARGSTAPPAVRGG